MRRLVLAALLALPATVMAALFGAWFAGERPPGVGTGTIAPCPGTPNCVSSSERDVAHRIAPIAYTGSTDAAMHRLTEVVAAMPGARIVVARPGYLYAEFTSRVMGFVDDFEAVAATPGTIEVRSASRVGRRDFGVNRARVESVRERMAQR